MEKNDIMTIISISNHVKKMWDYMVMIEERIVEPDNPMLEPLFYKFMEKGYKVNDLSINTKDAIDMQSIQSKEFFEDIQYMILKIEFMIEKNIGHISKNILITFNELRKYCEKMFYWDHESHIRIKYEIYS